MRKKKKNTPKVCDVVNADKNVGKKKKKIGNVWTHSMTLIALGIIVSRSPSYIHSLCVHVNNINMYSTYIIESEIRKRKTENSLSHFRS